MSLTTYKLTLDVKRDLHQVLVMKENDANSRCVEVTITDNGKLFDIGNNQVSLNWRKPDETFADTTCTKLSPSTVSFVCSRQMLLVPGIAKAELRLSDSSGTLLSTMPFHISIKPAAISNTDLTSSNEFKSLEKLLEDFHKEHEKVKEDVTALKHATENASKRAQSYSEGGTNSRQGEDTDNAKYYKNMAKSYSSGGTNLRQGEDTDNAKYYKQKALESANAAKLSEHYAEQYSTMSGDHASAAEGLFNMTEEKASDAKGYAEDAQNYAKEAKSYTHGGTNSRDGEDTDNSKYYYQQSKTIYDNFSQAGTVTGVKGNAEGSYRTGNVNLTAENIGAYGKLNIGTSGYNYQSNCIVIRGVSLNEIDESGLYFCDAPLDAPVTTNGFMIAITYAGKIRGIQLFMPLGENQIYKRQNTNGTWGGWEKINAGNASTATKATQDGDGNVITNSYAHYKIVSSGDFNTMTTPGLYTMRSPTANKPGNGGYFGLLVLKSDTGNYVEQIAFRESSYEVWVRTLSSSWSAWKRIGTWDGNGNVIADTYAKKSIYGDNALSMGRSTGTTVGTNSSTLGYNSTASGENSHAEGYYTTANGENSHAEGYYTTASNFASHALGKYNKPMETGGSSNTQIGDAFVIGNGFFSNNVGNYAYTNALRVTYAGDIYGTRAFQSSGADYAEFIKPWADDNKEEEDRIGYFVTIKDGLLYKAEEGDYIAGITSGNPSIVGNADEDYYWRYERDEFNRIIMEDIPEMVQKTDENGNPVFHEETQEPIMVETGTMISNARMKFADDYDPTMQNGYVERKDRKEWDYVGMLGILPVRDDGSCIPGQFCKCKNNGIATYTAQREFDTYMVIERISDHIISVLLK